MITPLAAVGDSNDDDDYNEILVPVYRSLVLQEEESHLDF